jgi:hypothetical protein
MRTVDQLLFGYRHGHELIAGSRELSAAALREVMPHADASLEPMEEHQLVGVWVDSIESYLLGRIWPAPEHSRPGAVWAHVLLIGAEDLRAGPLSALPTLLRRPDEGALDYYSERLDWPPELDPITVPPPLGRALVDATRPGDDRPHVVLWPTPAQAESALVALLDVMPAARRAGLSFRTRERARPGASAYRVQVAASLRGGAADTAAPVIDARDAPPAG